jgi:hypothetical protein
MFRTLADRITALLTTPPLPLTAADIVFTFHPEQLSRWLDEMWARQGIATWAPLFTGETVPLGDPAAVALTRLPGDLLTLLGSGVNIPTPQPSAVPFGFNPPNAIGTTGSTLLWDHMLYAYLVESTGVFEILAEVVRRYVSNETLPTPTAPTMTWVRATEELFFRDPPLFRVGGLTSQLRPDARINRRNVYWRMFGLDLPHPVPGIEGQPWKRDTLSTSNTRFLEIWNELLRQVWLGIENERNSSGSNPTDANYVAYLCQTIGEMLRLRRRGGMLSREEFSYVAIMSWFHLTVEFDTAVVQDLSANAGGAGNPADRLAAVGVRVGMNPSRQSRELFELAKIISPVLWAIELKVFDAAAQAELLYKSTGIADPRPAQLMNRIIDLWQSATGQNVKDLAVTQRRVQAPVRSAQPTKLLPPAGPAPTARSSLPSTNGQPVAARP